MEKLTVEEELWIAAPPERVWSAIVSADQMSKWWHDHWEIKELKRGAPISFGREDNRKYMTVETVETNKKFAIRWQPPAVYGKTDLLTIFELEEEKEGTRIKVLETGFEALPAFIRASRMQGTAGTYKKMLEQLKGYVEADLVHTN